MVYLDYAATTPMMDEVIAAMIPYQQQFFGNPSSVYGAGREAKKGLEEAREKVADAIGAQPAEMIFTAGGTEADNLALKGAMLKADPRRRHIITSSIEHHAVLHSAEWLERQGYRVTFLPVDGNGLVNLDALKASLSPETAIVSVMLANNEVGTIQPLREIVDIVKENSRALVHTDAVQGLGKIPVDVDALGVDMAAFAAHKLGGPKGVGALYLRRKTPIAAQLHGGGQERELRSGTPNVAGIVGFGVAAEISAAEVKEQGDRLSQIRDRLQSAILERIPDVSVNAAGAPRVPGTLSVCIRGVEGESLLLMLDHKGVAASSGSACASGSLEPSHVLLAMGIAPEVAHGSLRLSLGRGSLDLDVEAVVETLSQVVERLRSIAPKFAKNPA
ncbi:MAG TPA: cysteine desulfurase family protein [Actinomycetota bacterium]|nr:cysteine desulfurase family protein [Actinomycetota bacterium]